MTRLIFAMPHFVHESMVPFFNFSFRKLQTQMPEHPYYSQNVTVLLQECMCHRFPLWIALISLWKLVILIQALVLAWKIRNVSVPTLNDSSLTITAIFGAVLLSIVCLMASSAFHFQPNVVYILTTALIAGSSSWVQAVLFLPKVLTCPCNVDPIVDPITPHFYIVKLGFSGVNISFLFCS